MWGSPLPDEFFKTAEENPRPIMIASRKLMPLAYLELTKGLTASFRTIYGTGEFLYPIVLDAIATELRKPEESTKDSEAAA